MTEIYKGWEIRKAGLRTTISKPDEESHGFHTKRAALAWIDEQTGTKPEGEDHDAEATERRAPATNSRRRT